MGEHPDQRTTGHRAWQRFIWTTVPPLIAVAVFAGALLQIILPAVERHTITDRRNRCRELTQTASSIIDGYYQRQVEGELTAPEAKRRAAEQIRGLRYGREGKDYFWINDFEPRMIMHPYRSHLEGQYIGDFIDRNGKRLFVEFVRAVKDSGQGFVDYYWHHHDSDSVVAKLSFVKGFEPWEWIIGTGVYVGDLQAAVNSLRAKVIWACALAVLLVILVSGLIAWRYLVTEKQREQAESRWQHLVESLPEIVFECDFEGRLLFCNRTTYEMIGHTGEELCGKLNVTDLVIPAQHAELQADIERTLSGQQLSEREYQLRRMDGSTFPALVATKPLRERGRPVGFRGIAVDITERVQMEEALRRERDFTHRLIQSSENFFVALDSARRILMINPSMLEATGYLFDEVIGEDFIARFVPPDDRQSVRSALESLEQSNDPLRGESSILARDGRRLLVDWLGRSVLDSEGNIDFTFTIGVDITEKRQMESEAMRMAQLASIGELAAGVAHEVNNPITGIINYGQLIADESAIPENLRRMAAMIVREGERIARIVRSLLNLSRAQEGQRYPTDLSEILDASFSLWRKQLEHDNVELSIDCPQDLSPVMVDPQRIQQVCINLLSNSRYALNERHGKAVDAKHLKITCRPDNRGGSQFVRIEFYDNGTGIPRDIRDTILNPFFTTKPAGEGTGLGMSISHGIVEEHGGRMEIESDEGVYTRIIVWLPTVAEHELAECKS